MKQKTFSPYVLVLTTMLFGGLVFAQGASRESQRSPNIGAPRPKTMPSRSSTAASSTRTLEGRNERPPQAPVKADQHSVARPKTESAQVGNFSQLRALELELSAEIQKAIQPVNSRLSNVEVKLSTVETNLTAVLKEARGFENVSNKVDGLQQSVNGLQESIKTLQGAMQKLQESIPSKDTAQEKDKETPSSSVPAWIALGTSSLSAVAIIVVLVVVIGVRSRLEQLNKCVADCFEKNQKSYDDINKSCDGINAAVEKLPKSLNAQLKQLMDKVLVVEGKTERFLQMLKDIPKQIETVTRTMSRDAESNRGSIISCLFGRGKTSAPENGLAQQIEDRIGQFQAAILAAVETDQKLQARKVELDGRERKLKERENELAAECARARDEGAAAAERRAASFEAANKVLTDNMNAKAVEFGKRIAALEDERNTAKTAAQQAEAACAAAKSQADAAMKIRDKLTGEITRLSSEMSKRDQARESELATARDEIKSKIEKDYADEAAALRAEVTNARAERDRTQKAADSLLAQKNAVDSELSAVKASLAAEKAAHENDRVVAERGLAAEKAERESDRQKAVKEIAALKNERDAAMSRVFPAEFREDPDFQPLLSALDEWDSRNVPGSALARASLAIFADRKNQPTKIWQRALGDLSLGIPAAMDSEKKAPVDVANTLGQWKAVIEKRAGGNTPFSLKLPSIGSHVDTSWMHAKQGSAKVSRVRSWAVYGQAGNVYMAEVE